MAVSTDFTITPLAYLESFSTPWGVFSLEYGVNRRGLRTQTLVFLSACSQTERLLHQSSPGILQVHSSLRRQLLARYTQVCSGKFMDFQGQFIQAPGFVHALEILEVLEFQRIIFQAYKVLDFDAGPGNSW